MGHISIPFLCGWARIPVCVSLGAPSIFLALCWREVWGISLLRPQESSSCLEKRFCLIPFLALEAPKGLINRDPPEISIEQQRELPAQPGLCSAEKGYKAATGCWLGTGSSWLLGTVFGRPTSQPRPVWGDSLGCVTSGCVTPTRAGGGGSWASPRAWARAGAQRPLVPL